MSAELSRPSQAASIHLPRRFGRYALFDFIGRGGMAEIFLARATTELGAARLCVVKQIIPTFASHPQFAEMLIHEAKLAARLNHANIAQVFDLGREGDQLYIAMEYVEGFDLNALLRQCSQAKVPLPFEFALGIVCEMLKGLDYAHRRTDDDGRPLGIVHRDVSPSNVLISLEGEVKLCDFGIAHANDLAPQSGPQIDEAIKGKAGYMSPEHARGDAIDARADVFATGIVLWEIVAGHRMYRKEGAASLLDQARRADVPPLPSKGLPAEAHLYSVIERALQPDREQRFPSAGAMLRALQEYMGEARIVASPLKLGQWMCDQFGAELGDERRRRQRLAPVPREHDDARAEVPAPSLPVASANASGFAVAATRASVGSVPSVSTPSANARAVVRAPDSVVPPPSMSGVSGVASSASGAHGRVGSRASFPSTPPPPSSVGSWAGRASSLPPPPPEELLPSLARLAKEEGVAVKHKLLALVVALILLAVAVALLVR